MDIGMLWFDDDRKRTLEEKVRRAVEHYTRKYGQRPTLCFVNPQTVNGGPDVVAGIRIRKARTVMPDHFWVGYDEREAKAARRTTRPRVAA